ncbi:hypothetical protein Leryth_021259 [Lithospermum erythrorhizon]|nr:hypothetical protein Leryth_021259 [Lithospermum erythrorhizon]
MHSSMVSLIKLHLIVERNLLLQSVHFSVPSTHIHNSGELVQRRTLSAKLPLSLHMLHMRLDIFATLKK